MKIFLFFIGVMGSLFAKDIHIAVAANVSYAMPNIKAAFEKNYPHIKLHYTIGSSGKLTTQIKRKAPFDLFLSANMFYPRWLYKHNLSYTRPLVYAKGALVFVSKKPLKSLEELPKLHSIAIANPKTAPYGKASFEVLQKLHLLEKLKPTLRYGESIAQTLFYTLKACDGGFVAKSALFDPKVKRLKLTVLEIDPNLYKPIEQGVVVIRPTQEALTFFAFLFSKECSTILREYGYIIDE